MPRSVTEYLPPKCNDLCGGETGLYQIWHKNGQLMIEGHYRDGKKLGVWRNWDKRGRLVSEENMGSLE